MKKHLKILAIVAAIVCFHTTIAHAYQLDEALRPTNSPFTTNDKDAAGSLITILQIISGGLLYFAAPLAIIMITFIGINMNIGGADSEKIEQEKKNLTWLIIGLFLIILSYTIVRAVLTIAINAADTSLTPSDEELQLQQMEELKELQDDGSQMAA